MLLIGFTVTRFDAATLSIRLTNRNRIPHTLSVYAMAMTTEDGDTPESVETYERYTLATRGPYGSLLANPGGAVEFLLAPDGKRWPMSSKLVTTIEVTNWHTTPAGTVTKPLVFEFATDAKGRVLQDSIVLRLPSDAQITFLEAS